MLELSSWEQQGLLSFIGYGNPRAPLRFVGAEEGLGGAMTPPEQETNLRARCTWPEIADMKAAHATLVENGRPIDISQPRSGSTAVWRFMSRIALAAEGRADFNDDRQVTNYVRNRLGRRGATTLLTELSPVPAKRSSQPLAIRSIADHDLKLHLERRRQKQLRILRGACGITICFGLAKKEEFERHLELKWQPMNGRIWKGDNGMAFLLPFFGNGQLSKADVAAFVTSDGFRAALARLSATMPSRHDQYILPVEGSPADTEPTGA